MWRVSRWSVCAFRSCWGNVVILLAFLATLGWSQSGDGTPMVSFLEPSEGATISANVDTVQIRFRLISPDNTNLMRYQPFVNGLPGNEPIPIDPPSPQVELTILWRGVKQFPDGVHIITIKVVDAKGREGMGSLTLYKGRDSTKPTAEILTPKSGDVIRGEVPILLRVSDDRGVKAIAINATQRETAKTYTIYLAAGNYGRFTEIRVTWNTAEKHPDTKEDMFPDGVYLLQAKVRDTEDNEGFSKEVLVVVQNKLAQPVISQVSPGQTIRGGATLPTVFEPERKTDSPKLGLTLDLPTNLSPSTTPTLAIPQRKENQEQISTPSLVAQTRPTVPESQSRFSSAEIDLKISKAQRPMEIAFATPVLQPRLNLALSVPENAGQRKQVEVSMQRSDLPLPRIAGAVSSSRPNLSVSSGESKFIGVPIKFQLPATASDSPKIASLPKVPISAPTSQIKLTSVWIPPNTRTLKRATEVPESPTIATPPLMPRLPEPEVRTQKPKPSRLSYPSVIVQPSHSFRYTVIAGDTLYNLAEKFGISVKDLSEANGLPENAPLRIGQRLIIPTRPVTVLVDGKVAQCEVPAFLRNGTVVGSFRAVVEASGGIVGWDNEQKQATAIVGSLSIVATISAKTLNVNGESVPLSIAPFILRNRTFLPLRDLGISMGKEVQWQKGTLMIETPKR